MTDQIEIRLITFKFSKYSNQQIGCIDNISNRTFLDGGEFDHDMRKFYLHNDNIGKKNSYD